MTPRLMIPGRVSGWWARAWWVRSRRLIPALAVIFALEIVSVVAGARTIGLISLSSGGAVPAAVSLLLPAIVAVAVAGTLGRGLQLDRIAVRPVRLLDSLCGVGAVALVAVVGLGLAAAGMAFPTGFARNTAGLVGISLAVQPRFGSAIASVAPTVFVISASLFGSTSGPTGRQLRWWAYPLAPPADSASAVLALTCLAGGWLIFLAASRRQ